MSRRKPLGFNRAVIKAAGEKWEDVRRYNAVLRRLQKRRETKVERASHLAASKIAWKAAVLQQAYLYRVIELARASAKMWNLANVLCSVLAARALLETIAVVLDVETRLQTHAAANDFKTMDELITSHTFDAIAKAGAGFRPLGDPWADTTTPHGRLMLTVLGGLAEFERHLIPARTDEGRKRAKARGVAFGPKFKLTKHQREEARARRYLAARRQNASGVTNVTGVGS